MGCGRRRIPRRCPAVSARVARALLPDDRIDARRRGPGAGHLPARMEVLQGVPGQILGPDLALPHRDEHRLTALDGRQRRPLPSGLGQGRRIRAATSTSAARYLAGAAARSPKEDPSDPSVIVESRESVRLAFVAALQHLSARQRAVLVLREVLQWKAAEVADAIGASTAAVNSLLQRARAQLDAVAAGEDDEVAAPDSAEAQDLLAKLHRGVRVLRHGQAGRLFTEDAIWEMPPFDGWYQGPADIVTLSRNHCPAEGPGDMRFIRHHRQRSARRGDVHAQPRDRQARAVPVARPRRPPGRDRRTWWRSTRRVVREVRAAGSVVAAPRNARLATRLLALSLRKSTFATASAGNGL